MYYYSNMSTLKIIYFAYFHAAMEYGIYFWGGGGGKEMSVLKMTDHNVSVFIK
jgi:hypothetical protein